MDTKVTGINGRRVELVVHIDDFLGESRRQDIETALEGDQGVFRAQFTDKRPHLMRVAYNPEQMSSVDILGRVKAQSVHAELIGPI